jgi:hypothetical protein
MCPASYHNTAQLPPSDSRMFSLDRGESLTPTHGWERGIVAGHSTTGHCARGMGLGIHAVLKGLRFSARGRVRDLCEAVTGLPPRWQQSHPGA